MATDNLKREYNDRIVPALMKEFGYTSVMQVPVLEKIVISQGIGGVKNDGKWLEAAIHELSLITGQKPIVTSSNKDVSNFNLRRGDKVGLKVTLRREKMYEFLERLIRIALPRIRDFQGVPTKFDGRGNYTLGIEEQIIFPEINLDNVYKFNGFNVTFVTSAETDEEGFALLREFGMPFKRTESN